MFNRILALAGLALGTSIGLFGLAPMQADADTYPSKPVTIIVPSGAGGATDTTARSVAPVLSEALGQPFVVENQPGAQGLVATPAFVKAPADGYTLMLMASSQAVLPAVREIPYDPVNDIQEIARLSVAPVMLVVNADLPVTTVEEFIAYAKEHPGEISYGYQGGPPQIGAATFARLVGIEPLAVPFKASAEAMNELVAGRLTYLMMTAEQAKAQTEGGTLRVLAAAGPRRADAFPDIPTLQELGYDVDAYGWFGLVAPAGTPEDVIETIHNALTEHYIGKAPQKAMAATGLEAADEGPEEFSAFVEREIKRWQELAEEAGIARQPAD